MMHLDAHKIYKFIDDKKFKLCDLFHDKGKKFQFVYDLGDLWQHVITLDEILPAEKSDGRVCT